MYRLSYERRGDISFIARETISYFVTSERSKRGTKYDIVTRAINSYINTRGNWKNSKLRERASAQFLVFPISTRVDVTVYLHAKCLIFLKLYIQSYTNTIKLQVFRLGR